MKFNEDYIPGLGRSAAVEALVIMKANDIANTAISSAPVVTGDYRDSIHVEVTHTPYRVVAEVVASSGHALAVEARHGTLARALRSNVG